MMFSQGEDIAKQFAGAQTAKMAQRAGACASTLKPYFHVSNRYVLKKFEMILFPYRRVMKKASWAREDQKEPVADPNAPDLYLPLMSCITFVLLVGLLEGRGGKFTPDILGHVMSITLALLAVEVIAIYVTVRALKGTPLGWLDATAYCGYKYVPLCINTLAGLFFGYNAYLWATALTGLSYSLFVFKTLSAASFTPPGNASQFQETTAAKHKVAALVIAIVEFLLLFVHGHAGSSRLATVVSAGLATMKPAVASTMATAKAAAEAIGGGDPLPSSAGDDALEAISKFAASKD
jgi:hypothetical protein